MYHSPHRASNLASISSVTASIALAAADLELKLDDRLAGRHRDLVIGGHRDHGIEHVVAIGGPQVGRVVDVDLEAGVDHRPEQAEQGKGVGWPSPWRDRIESMMAETP